MTELAVYVILFALGALVVLMGMVLAQLRRANEYLRIITNSPPQQQPPAGKATLFWLFAAGWAWASSPAEAVAAAYKDTVALAREFERTGADARDLEAFRYFWVTTPPGRGRERLRAAFRLHLNLLSRRATFVDIHEVRPDLWRLDVDAVLWDRATLEAARFIDPFFHLQQAQNEDATFDYLWPGGTDTSPLGNTPGLYAKRGPYRYAVGAGKAAPLAAPWLPTREMDALRKALYTEVPILSAEWFLAQSARQLSLANEQTGLGYYDFLRLKDREDYFRLVRFKDEDSVAVGKDFLALAEASGVSPAPRVVASKNATSGILFLTLDTNLPRGRGIPLRDLRSGKFKHQIEEYYAPLPNGLPATFLSDDKGTRQNNAPADAAGFGDTSKLNRSKDVRVHINLACMRCHAGKVIQDVDDYARETFRPPVGLGVKEKRDRDRLHDQYFSNLSKRIRRAREDYQEAFAEATVTRAYPKGMTAQEASEAYAEAYHDYADRPVTPALAARWLGVPGGQYSAALFFALKSGKLPTRLAPHVAEAALPLSILTWEDAYGVAQEIIQGYLPKEP